LRIYDIPPIITDSAPLSLVVDLNTTFMRTIPINQTDWCRVISAGNTSIFCMVMTVAAELLAVSTIYQLIFVSSTLHTIQKNVKTSRTKMRSMVDIVSSSKSQHSAGYHAISKTPVDVTDGAPCSIVVNLNRAFVLRQMTPIDHQAYRVGKP
jgi:hypothetical protein